MSGVCIGNIVEGNRSVILEIQSLVRTSNYSTSQRSCNGYNIKRFNTSFKLIDETYNANPYSVKNAIKKLSESKNNTSKKYILLSDMLELGKKSEFYHKDLSKIINKAELWAT